MCLDPLPRVQLLIAEAIDQLVLSCEKQTVDPAVVEAILSRLRAAKQQLGRAQTSRSRCQAFKLTREVIVKVATELAFWALMTTNCLLQDPARVREIDVRRNYQEIAFGERPFSGGSRTQRRNFRIVPFPA